MFNSLCVFEGILSYQLITFHAIGNKELKQKHRGAYIEASTQTKGEIGKFCI